MERSRRKPNKPHAADLLPVGGRWQRWLEENTMNKITSAWIVVIGLSVAVAMSVSCEAQTSDQVDEPEQDRIFGKWEYMKLPELTDTQRFQLAIQAGRNRERHITQANVSIQELSEKLESYIHLWLAGKADAKFPEGFFPPSIDNERTHSWRLVKPNDIDPNDQWYALPAYDPKKELRQFSPDPHVTYLKLVFLAPLGAKLLIEGDFPHARFMSYQILSSVDPLHPITGQIGICEVPIVDVDIDPDPGHVNPFRPGADRTANKRHYHLTFDLRTGNAVDLNPQAMKAPEYRGAGNVRVGGPFAFTGPWGNNVLVPSVVWLRYYAPDRKVGLLGGVPLPKATLQMPSGEKFWLTCDKSLAVKLQTDTVPRIKPTPAIDPYPFIGSDLGWFKMFGILHLHAEGRAYYKSKPWGPQDPVAAKERIRRMFSLMFNRGAQATPPGNYETAATCCNHISYLGRPMSLGANKVIVLTGRLPKFPATVNGEKTMTGGEVRYFSITHQVGSNSEYNKGYHGTPYGSLMDEEIVLNKNNEYIIVYSRESDRPANARTENGITWQDWGDPSSQSFVIRWLSVMPDWHLSQYAPDQKNIPWETGAWSEEKYDQNLVGKNKPGVMGPYHPVIHYMTKSGFEALGNKTLSPHEIPVWR